jgi:hypothetical protein
MQKNSKKKGSKKSKKYVLDVFASFSASFSKNLK